MNVVLKYSKIISNFWCIDGLCTSEKKELKLVYLSIYFNSFTDAFFVKYLGGHVENRTKNRAGRIRELARSSRSKFKLVWHCTRTDTRFHSNALHMRNVIKPSQLTWLLSRQFWVVFCHSLTSDNVSCAFTLTHNLSTFHLFTAYYFFHIFYLSCSLIFITSWLLTLMNFTFAMITKVRPHKESVVAAVDLRSTRVMFMLRLRTSRIRSQELRPE